MSTVEPGTGCRSSRIGGGFSLRASIAEPKPAASSTRRTTTILTAVLGTTTPFQSRRAAPPHFPFRIRIIGTAAQPASLERGDNPASPTRRSPVAPRRIPEAPPRSHKVAVVYDVYEYDTRNRLTGACYALLSTATTSSGATNALSYAYDKVSNRTQEIRAGSVGNTGTITSAYNSADQLTSTTKSGVTVNYTYDTNGNQATSGSRTDTYDLANQLASSASGGVTSTYGYDGDGHRTSSTTSGGGADLRYSWDTLAESSIPELALEQDTSGNLIRRYLNERMAADIDARIQDVLSDTVLEHLRDEPVSSFATVPRKQWALPRSVTGVKSRRKLRIDEGQ